MSFMHFDTVTAVAVPGIVVSLGGGTAFHIDNFSARAGWKFQSNGTVFRIVDFSATQVNSLTDWIIPHDSASVSYEIRAHKDSGNATIIGPTLDTFHTLDATREWTADCGAICIENATLFIDIRFEDGSNTSINNKSSLFDGANVMATATYIISLHAEGFL